MVKMPGMAQIQTFLNFPAEEFIHVYVIVSPLQTGTEKDGDETMSSVSVEAGVFVTGPGIPRMLGKHFQFQCGEAEEAGGTRYPFFATAVGVMRL
ncbi:uncharacterized protein N7473_011133 [Penicillium subrubescens]|uniref:uncharacterized protein n=1 Tax=Penicillium subrubescens TaxID=1316194 RepID=UPI002545AC95|nr:uncharacterized protein N7473_011133 [Penicillium subrubescens]KAJ5882699.1 hypothetical protein N7473_011133 [Penicillium subrubescens]